MPGEIVVDNQKGDAKEPPAKPVIGIIYPPPEVRNIVDKTAGFVARNGQSFEVRIRQNEINNPKFNFLNPTDPYHAYYQHKVTDFREGRGQEPAAPKPQSAAIAPPAPAVVKVAEPIKPVVEVQKPREPPPENEFTSDPPSISAFDLDVVKLTAQFVARNGRQFLTTLMNRESRNYQFDFLRPQHSLFNYFTKLVEQYTKIMIPPKDLMNNLKQEADTQRGILDEVTKRVEWINFQEREKQKIEEAVEKERVAYAQIDWHDFVVVETVDFQPNETGNLPPPTTPELVGARVLAQERAQHEPVEEADKAEQDDEEMQETEGDMDMGSDTDSEPGGDEEADDDASTASEAEDVPPAPEMPPPPPTSEPGPPPLPEIPQPPPQPPAPDKVVIKDYNPKAKKLSAEEEKFLKSPLTQEMIPADKLAQHMKYGMLDPSWIAQKERMVRDKQEQDSIAPGSSISTHLSNFAERRTDIFGAEETQIGKKIGEERNKDADTVQWDGHSGSADSARAKAREGITPEQRFREQQERLGLIADPSKERIGPKKGESESSAPAPAPPTSKPAAPKPAPPEPPKPTPPPQPPQARPPAPPPMERPPHPMPPRMGGPPMPPGPPRPPMQQNVVMMQARPPLMSAPGPPRPGMVGIPVMQPHPGGPPRMGFMRPSAPIPVQVIDEPPHKRAKTEDQLIPEDQFLKNAPKVPVQFQVAVPNVPEKPEWKLNGQSVKLMLPLTDPVSVIKAKLHEALGIPAGKQKLQFEGMFIKDSNSLAFYNMSHGALVQLQLKERGGRKK